MVLFTLLGLYGLFRRKRKNGNNTHSGQDENVDQSDDHQPLERNDGQTSQDISSDPVVLPNSEEPITGDPQFVDDCSQDQSVEERSIDDPQVDEDWSKDLSLELPSIDNPQVNEDWSKYLKLELPIIDDLKVDEDWRVDVCSPPEDTVAPQSSQQQDISSGPVVFFTIEEPISQDQSVEERIIDDPQVDDGWRKYLSLELPSIDAPKVDEDWSKFLKLELPIIDAPKVDEDWIVDVCNPPEDTVAPQSSQQQDFKKTIIEINSIWYTIGNQLGQGGFGAVFEATRLQDGVQVAVKFASKMEAMEYVWVDGYCRPLPKEVMLHILASEPRVPQIIQLLDWQDQADQYIMVLERPMPCQSLDTFLRRYWGPMDENLARVIMWQVALAAHICCQRGVFHRDIKLENLLINPDTFEIKLIDFGCGAFLNSAGYTSYAGTRAYRPLECIIDGRYHGEPATVWSLGIVLFVLLYRNFPSSSDLGKIFKEDIVTQTGLSQECCDFICSCLQLDPNKRIKLENVLLHDWFERTSTAFWTSEPVPHAGPVCLLDQRTSSPCWTSEPEARARPVNQQPVLDQQTSTACWTSLFTGPANQQPMLDQRTRTACWTSLSTGPANQHRVLDQRTSATCWTSEPASRAGPANQRRVLDQRTSAPCWTSEPAPRAGPAYQCPVLDQQTSTAFWTSESAAHAGSANQNRVLDQFGYWTSEPASRVGPANQRRVLDQRTSAPCWTSEPAPRAGPAYQRPVLDQQTSTAFWTSESAAHAGSANQNRVLDQFVYWTSEPAPSSGPANQRHVLDKRTSVACWTSEPAPRAGPANQRPVLDQRTSAPFWTSVPAPRAGPANQHRVLDQRISSPCWISKPEPRAGPVCLLDQRTSATCWTSLSSGPANQHHILGAVLGPIYFFHFKKKKKKIRNHLATPAPGSPPLWEPLVYWTSKPAPSVEPGHFYWFEVTLPYTTSSYHPVAHDWLPTKAKQG